MQGQRQEIVRKQRKLLSRDRSGPSKNPNHRRSKDSNEPNSPSDRHSSKNKYIFIGIKHQISQLKEEVAKLSVNKNSSVTQQKLIRAEYQGQTPEQKKSITDYYFDQSSEKKIAVTPFSVSESQRGINTPSTGTPKKFQQEHLLQQLKQSQRLNQDLELKNQELRAQIGQISESLKKEFDVKIKQLEYQRERRAQSRQRENDRTVGIQRKSQEQQKTINDLKDKIVMMSNELQKAKNENNLMIKTNQSIIRQYEDQLKNKNYLQKQQFVHKQRIIKIQAEYKQLELLQQQTSEKLKSAQQIIQVLQNQKNQKNSIVEDAKAQIVRLTAKIKQLQGRKDERVIEQSQKKSDENINSKVDQLKQIIKMQQQSMENYESDLNYLETELQKHINFKEQSKKLTVLTQQLNEQCIKAHSSLLNARYMNKNH